MGGSDERLINEGAAGNKVVVRKHFIIVITIVEEFRVKNNLLVRFKRKNI